MNMHVHELNPKKTIITMAIFVVVIIIGLLTLTSPRLKYKISPIEAVSTLANDNLGVDASNIENMLSGSITPTILIDIRNNYDYARGHIPSAENISAVDLLSVDNIKRLNELKNTNTSVVIYGDTPIQANGPWMVLQQLGFSNVKYLLGGYEYYLTFKDAAKDNHCVPSFENGNAKYNYAEIAKANSGGTIKSTSGSEKKTTIVRRKKKGAATAGGC